MIIRRRTIRFFINFQTNPERDRQAMQSSLERFDVLTGAKKLD
jgi:hypothetical protein